MLKKMINSATMKDHLREVFLHSVQAVSPQELVLRSLSRKGNVLSVNGKQYTLNQNVYLVGFGKAVLRMATSAVPLLDGHLKGGVLSVPVGSDPTLIRQLQEKHIDVFEGAKNNQPDAQSLKAARKIKELASNLKANHILLVLISEAWGSPAVSYLEPQGGGSALLPLPKGSLTLEEKQQVIKLLSFAGASICELNQVRIALSGLKGGQLAEQAGGAHVISLILSDIIGDPLHLIASGPTVQPSPSEKSAHEILHKFDLLDKIPAQVLEHLPAENASSVSNSLPLPNVQNVLVGNNLAALESAALKARELGHTPILVSDSVSGDVSKVSEFYKSLARVNISDTKAIQSALLKAEFPVLPIPEINQSVRSAIFIAGGEPTVVVRGQGKGGRNQELALSVGCSLPTGACFLSAGTDGLDGPTDVAGAVCDVSCAQSDLSLFLDNNDSYTFLNNVGSGNDFIRTGHTGTNVMDVHLLLVQKL